MKGFRFRLDSVLRLRGHELDARLRDLATANAELARARRTLGAAQKQSRRASQRLMDRAGEGIGAGDFELAERALVCARAHVKQYREAVRRAEAEAEDSRARVAAARTRVRALEILRERALRAHRERELKQEQAVLDEIAGQRSGRTGRNSGWSRRLTGLGRWRGSGDRGLGGVCLGESSFRSSWGATSGSRRLPKAPRPAALPRPLQRSQRRPLIAPPRAWPRIRRN